LPEVKEVNSAPDIKTSKEVNISILTGNGNPDPVKEETWKEWEAWRARAVAVDIIAPDIDRAVVTDADLRRYINTEISGMVTTAEEA
jgi:hypothetical protein